MPETIIRIFGRERWAKNWWQTFKDLKMDLPDEMIGKETYQEVLMDDRVAGAVIATSSPSHFEVAQASMAAGMNVLIEKPMTTTVEQARRLVEYWQQNKVLVAGVAFNMLENDVVKKMKRLMGHIGDLKGIHFEANNASVREGDEEGILDWSPHVTSLLKEMTGSYPQEVSAEKLGEHDTLLTYKLPKVEATVRLNLKEPVRGRLYELRGPNGTLQMKWGQGPDTLAYLAPGEKVGVNITPPLIRTPLANQALMFVKCINTDTPPTSSLIDGLNAVLIAEKLQQSLSLGGRIETVSYN